MDNKLKSGLAFLLIVLIIGSVVVVSNTNFTGIQGIQGIAGINGLDFNSTIPYTLLFNGSQGIQGEIGLTGSQGIQGETGLTGNQGIQGIQGTQGVQGETGITGINGTNSPTLYLQDGLVLHLPFDGVALDVSGYRNDGIIYGASFVAGRFAQALNFNGTTNYVDCGNGASLNILGDITFSVWLKQNSTTGTHNIICKGITGTEGYRFLTYMGYIWFYGSQNGVFQETYSVSDALTVGVWQYVVFVRSGAVATIYVDGVDKTLVHGNHLDFASSTKTCYIGVQDDVTNNFFDGIIDEVRIYNRALSQSEITALFNQPT